MAIFFQLNNKKNSLFATNRHTHRKFIVAILIAGALMATDIHYRPLDAVRHVFSFFIAPLQYLVDYPSRLFLKTKLLVLSKKELISENEKLRHQQTMLEVQLQKLLIIRNENSQLKELLLTAANTNTQAMAAQILAVETSHSRQILIINKGSREGVFQGQPVLDAKGVMGQIIDVGYMTSTVLLVSDSKCAIPVQNNRTGERAILVGTNDISQLSLINLPKTSSIKAGDVLVTSGLGRRYPKGYPVGKVEEIKHVPGDEFIKVNVTPMALLNRNQLVLLIWPEKEYAILTSQIAERISALDESTKHT